MLIHINEYFTIVSLNHLLNRKKYFSTDLHYQFLHEVMIRGRLNWICCIRYLKFDRIDVFIKVWTIFRGNITESENKGHCWLLFLFLLKNVILRSVSYELRIVSLRRRAPFVPMGMQIFCWKKNLPNVTNVLSINNSTILIMSVSKTFLFESEWYFT